MEWWRILAIVGGILFYIGIMTFIFVMQHKQNKMRREFWDKYFRYLESKSAQTCRDIEAGKIKVTFHNGQMIMIEPKE